MGFKPFETYQCLPGEPMTTLDRKQVGSKFWNTGKWDNFIKPHLPKDPQDMTFVDVGCNAGLFLQLAKEYGFKHVIGIEKNKEAFEKAKAYQKKHSLEYSIYQADMVDTFHYVQCADVILLSNVHYYLDISEWLQYLDQLPYKTQYCIVVTKPSEDKHWMPKTGKNATLQYFKDWIHYEIINNVSRKDPFPRPLLSILFESKQIKRVPIDSLHHDGKTIDLFYEQIAKGMLPLKTQYRRRWNRYRKHIWSQEEIDEFVKDKAFLYRSLELSGQEQPIFVDYNGFVCDGNHRLEAMKRLGYKTILTRRVLV